MGNRETAIRNLKLGVNSPGKSKRGKGYKVIAKENARKAYEEKLAKEFEEISEIQFESAKWFGSVKERIYVINQMIGEPEKKMALSGVEGNPIAIDVTIKSAIDKTYGEGKKD